MSTIKVGKNEYISISDFIKLLEKGQMNDIKFVKDNNEYKLTNISLVNITLCKCDISNNLQIKKYYPYMSTTINGVNISIFDNGSDYSLTLSNLKRDIFYTFFENNDTKDTYINFKISKQYHRNMINICVCDA